jgi:hypothetical protein
MYETKTARKRKSLTASPPYTRKKGAVNVVSEDAEHSNGLQQLQHKKPPTKRPRVTRKPKAAQFEITDNLIPIRSSRLNATSAAEKRTSSQAFGSGAETRPAKKILAMGVESTPARQFDTDSDAKEETEAVRDVSTGNTKQHFSDIENTMQAENEDSEDLFDNDDTCLEEFLEAEKALFAETFAAPFPSSSKAADTPEANGKHQTLDKPPLSRRTRQPPMRPFIRPFAPLPSTQDTSPTGSIVSPLHRSPVCFRIAEALRYISSAFVSALPTPTPVKTLSLEVYGILHSSKEDNGISGTIIMTLADIFFPHRPPYLTATTRKAITVLATSRKDKSTASHLMQKLQGNLICAVIQVTPASNTPPVARSRNPVSPMTPLARKYTTTLLRIEETDWDEIQRSKDILEGRWSSDSGSASKGPAPFSIAGGRTPSESRGLDSGR